MRVSTAMSRSNSNQQQQQKPAAPAKQSVLFLCIGNACRSQMAEAFARRYGSDVAEVASAGMQPASSVPEVTKTVMRDKNIPLGKEHFPKGVEAYIGNKFDVVVNMSGIKVPAGLEAGRLLDWKVQDPMGQQQAVHERVRDDIENRVMQLILQLRVGPRKPSI